MLTSLKKFFKFKIDQNLNPYTILNDKNQPNGNADNLIFRYLSLNNKAFASYIAQDLKNKILQTPVPSSPSIVNLISKVSTQSDIESDWSRYWVNELKQTFKYHRKQWEQSFILQVLFEHGMMQNGKKGIGLGCGKEPLPSYLASQGCHITAGDKPSCNELNQIGWKKHNQYTQSIDDLFHKNIIDYDTFKKCVSLLYVDMNNLPSTIYDTYDFCWSVCVIEHIGSVENGLNFLKNSLKLLKQGGISIHTTEFNYLGIPQRIDNWGSVIFNRKDFEILSKEIKEYGGEILGLDFSYGDGILDKYIDLPPFFHQTIEGINIKYPEYEVPHIKLNIDGFPATCFGIIIKKI